MLFEKISNNIASAISKTLQVDKDKQDVLAYGAYIVLDTLLAIGMVMLFGAIFGVFFQALVISFASAILRKTSGGAHATTSIRCATIGTVSSVGFALIIRHFKSYFNMPLAIAYLLMTFIISYYIILTLAPKDSPNKPIVKESKIKELKAKSIATLCIYAAASLIIITFSWYYKNQIFLPYVALICTGYLWQSVSLTSLGRLITYVMEWPFRFINFIIGGENK